MEISLERFGSLIYFCFDTKRNGQKPNLLGLLFELALRLNQGVQQVFVFPFLTCRQKMIELLKRHILFLFVV